MVRGSRFLQVELFELLFLDLHFWVLLENVECSLACRLDLGELSLVGILPERALGCCVLPGLLVGTCRRQILILEVTIACARTKKA